VSSSVLSLLVFESPDTVGVAAELVSYSQSVDVAHARVTVVVLPVFDDLCVYDSFNADFGTTMFFFVMQATVELSIKDIESQTDTVVDDWS